MQVETRPPDQGTGGAHDGFQGRGRGQGGGPSRGRGQIICYNCEQLGHFTQYYSNPTHPSCQYCRIQPCHRRMSIANNQDVRKNNATLVAYAKFKNDEG